MTHPLTKIIIFIIIIYETLFDNVLNLLCILFEIWIIVFFLSYCLFPFFFFC
jgi:phage-related holin